MLAINIFKRKNNNLQFTQTTQVLITVADLIRYY